MIYMFLLCFDFIIQCTWRSIDNELKTWLFLNGVVKVSQGFIFHVVDCISVCNGEVGVGNGNDRIGNGDVVIQFKTG